jgi:hypothetical protein
MRGHEPLIAMRLAGKRPRSVSVMLAKVAPWALAWDKHPATQGDAVIEIEAKDAPGLMDLRCLVGLDYVLVYGDDTPRTRAVVEACEKYAKRVIAAYFDDLPRCYNDPKIEEREPAHG